MVRPFAGTLAALAVVGAALVAAQQAPAPVDDAALARVESRSQDWLSYGRDYYEQRFSPLDQINDANVAKLGLAWSFETGDRSRPRGDAARHRRRDVHHRRRGASSTPSMRAPGSSSGSTTRRCTASTTSSRAATSSTAASRSTRAASTSARSTAGWSRSTPRAARSAWQTTTVDQKQPYTITGAPRVVKGKVIIGNGGAEYGVRGYVSAYDAETGKLAWRFYTVPGDPSKPQENKALDSGAADLEGRRLVEVRRRRHGVGFDRLRPRAQPALRRHRQWLAVEPRRCAAPAAATTSTWRRSWRSIPTTASWSGTTRRCPATPGTTPPSSR